MKENQKLPLHPLEIIAEWRKGCSCAIDRPAECVECTEAAMAAIEKWHTMTNKQDDLVKYLPWTGLLLKQALENMAEYRGITQEDAWESNITFRVGPFTRPYREIMAIAEEYGEREIPKSMRDVPIDIK